MTFQPYHPLNVLFIYKLLHTWYNRLLYFLLYQKYNSHHWKNIFNNFTFGTREDIQFHVMQRVGKDSII